MTDVSRPAGLASGFAGGATPLPNILVDDLLPHLSGTQTKLLLVVLRQTRGWRDRRTGQPKERDWLSQSQLMRRTGRASAALASAIDALVCQGFLLVETEDGTPLPTPQARRRQRGQLFYRLGPTLLGPSLQEPQEAGGAGGPKSEYAQANTTTNIPCSNKNSCRIRKTNAPLIPVEQTTSRSREQQEMIAVRKRQIRERLKSFL